MTLALQITEPIKSIIWTEHSEQNDSLLRRGVLYQAYVAVAAQFVELLFDSAVMKGYPGGLSLDRLLASMKEFVPELSEATRLQIVQIFIERRSRQMATGCTAPVPAFNAPNPTQRLKAAMLAYDPDEQRYIMVNFRALRDKEPLIGRVHPMARFLLRQSEQTIKEVIDAMYAQAKAAKNPAA